MHVSVGHQSGAGLANPCFERVWKQYETSDVRIHHVQDQSGLGIPGVVLHPARRHQLVCQGMYPFQILVGPTPAYPLGK